LKSHPVAYAKLPDRYPALFAGLAVGDPKAAAFFAAGPLVERARRAAARGMEAGVLERLRRRHAELGAPAASLEALGKLGRGAAAVVTGQQPQAGWGPIYTLYKAAGAIAVAAELEAAGVPSVAVFWNHSDDAHRGSTLRFPDREGGLLAVPFPAEEAGKPLHAAGSDESLSLFAAALADRLPRTEHAEALGLRIREEHRGSIAESFSRALLGALGAKGLVVVEPRDLDGERSAALFEAHQKDPERLSRAVEEGRAAVRSAGYDDALGKEVGLDLWELRDGRRLRVERPFAAKGRLSAGVALRPLLQDAVLPACAYLAGPHEAGYLAELGPAYAAFGIEAAAVLARPTATLLEPRAVRGLGMLGSAEAIFAGAGRGRAGEAGALARRLEGLRVRLGEELESAAGELAADPAVRSGLERTSAKIREALDAFGARLEAAEGRREDTREGRLRRLDSLVLPAGELQERVVTPLYYEALLGAGALGRIADEVGPLRAAHQCIEIL
jgi:uncharacterized protein YllA (UPF0747 family)